MVKIDMPSYDLYGNLVLHPHHGLCSVVSTHDTLMPTLQPYEPIYIQDYKGNIHSTYLYLLQLYHVNI